MMTVNRITTRRGIQATVVFASLSLASLGLGMSGCTSDGYPLDNTYHYQGKAPSTAPPPSTFRYRYPDVPPVLDVEGLKRLVSQYRHHVVLIDFWASWNQRNREEMQMLSRLQEDLADEGFQVIACSFDPPEKWGNVIVPMLHGGNANFPCVVIPESNRAAVREWLQPQWTYDVPARFVVSRTGKVVSFGFSETPLASIEQQTRDLVRHGLMASPNGVTDGRIARVAKAPDSGLRTKVINVNTGSFESIAEVTAGPGDSRKLADEMAAQIAQRIDRGENPRIGVLPFPTGMGRREADALGVLTADYLIEALQKQGFFDFVKPQQTQRLIQQANLTPTSIEYDPASVKGAVQCDYLVVGWLRETGSAAGDVPAQRANGTDATDAEDSPVRPASAGLEREPSKDEFDQSDDGAELDTMESIPTKKAASARRPSRDESEFEEDLP